LALAPEAACLISNGCAAPCQAVALSRASLFH